MADFGEAGNREFAQYRDVLTTGVRSGKTKLEGQTEDKPVFWLDVTCGGEGYFAVMMWNGEGYPEPWDTGEGRYRTRAEAEKEARTWADEEGLSFGFRDA